MAQYENYATNPSFQLPILSDPSAGARKKYQEDLSQMREFFARNRIVDQQRIEDASFVGQDLKALAPLLKSGAEITEKFAKAEATNKAIHELTDSALATDPNISEAEGNTYAFAEKAKGATKVATGVANETAFLNDLAGTLDSDVNALLQSDFKVNYKGKVYPLFQLAQNPQTAVLAVNFALDKIYEKRGVHYATKAGFVRHLAPVHRQVLANRTSNLISQANARQQRSNQAAIIQNASAAGAKLVTLAEGTEFTPEVYQSQVAESFNQQTNAALQFNTNMTASEINVSVLKSMLSASGRNPALREALENTVLPGNKQLLVDLYPKVFEDAQKLQEKEQKVYNQEQAENLMKIGLEELQTSMDSNEISLNELKKREQEIYREITGFDLTVAGSFSSQANRLINRREEEAYVNAANIIDTGGSMSVRQIMGLGLSPSKRDDLVKRLDTRTEVNSLIGDSLKTQMSSLKRQLASKAGFGLSSLESLTETEENWLGDPRILDTALKNFEGDIRRSLQAYARTPEFLDLDPAQKSEALNKKMLEYVNGLMEPGKAYQGFGYLSTGPESQKAQNAVQEMLREYADPSYISDFLQSARELNNLTSYWKPGNPASTNVQQRWQGAGGLGGKALILSYGEVQAYGADYNDSGEWNNSLKTLAESLGVNPRELWLQQNRNHYLIPPGYTKEERVVLNDTTEPKFKGNVQPGPELSKDERMSIGYQTSQWLIDSGFSENAAKAGYELFTASPYAEWENLLAEMKQDAALWSVLKDPSKSARQNLTALMIWETQRNEQQ